MNKFPPPLESIVAMLTNCDQPDQSDEEKKLEAQVRHQIQQYADQQSAELRARVEQVQHAIRAINNAHTAHVIPALRDAYALLPQSGSITVEDRIKKAASPHE